jgi:hypothetical protein
MGEEEVAQESEGLSAAPSRYRGLRAAAPSLPPFDFPCGARDAFECSPPTVCAPSGSYHTLSACLALVAPSVRAWRLPRRRRGRVRDGPCDRHPAADGLHRRARLRLRRGRDGHVRGFGSLTVRAHDCGLKRGGMRQDRVRMSGSVGRSAASRRRRWHRHPDAARRRHSGRRNRALATNALTNREGKDAVWPAQLRPW